MTIYHLSEHTPNWTTCLADILDEAHTADLLIVSSYAVLDLAKRALKRRPDGTCLRIVTEQTYRKIALEREGMGTGQ